MPSALPKTVLETILDWSNKRPPWQRDALRRVVSKGHQDDDDIQELVALCKIGKGAPEDTLKAVPLDKTHLPCAPGHGKGISIHSISEVSGVNSLAAKQIVEFEHNGITIIYGDNGAGKSGYGRILKRACRARHAGKIEPNIYSGGLQIQAATATFTYFVGDALQSPVKWQDSPTPHPTLSAISVFDHDCSAVQIKEKNEVAFRPFGLDIPDELADVCQRVKEVLTDEQKKVEANRHPVFAKPSWQASTVVGEVLEALNHSTDFTKITALGTLSEDEAQRLQQLREDLTKDSKMAAAEQKLKADNIKRLHGLITAIAERTTDASLTSIWTLYQDATTKRATAKIAAEKAFAREPLEGVGGAVWKQLWEAARRYSTEISYPDRPYPATEPSDLCVLCQQPLDKDARARLSRFEEFIQEDTERQAQQAEAAYKITSDETMTIRIAIKPIKSNLQELKLQDRELARKVTRYLASARLRRYSVFRAISATQNFQLAVTLENPLGQLLEQEAKIRAYADDLLKGAASEARVKLVQEFNELNDRLLLNQLLPTVEEEIERLRNLYFLDQCIKDTSTTAITRLGNDIADKQITPALQGRFKEEIRKLAAEKVHVDIIRSGGKYGSPQYQVHLSGTSNAKVADILSEGEQTCVGLAAFLTELATSNQNSALVFDDPVTSLDHRWRKQVAARLVEETRQRQIIVFTHDLIFVNDIHALATDKKLPVRCITVSRGYAGTGIVAPGLPWQGKSIEDRIDRLEKAARDAKILYDNNQDEDYKSAAVSIYNKLRASWERALEDVGFSRVIQRHRDYVDTKDLKKVAVLTDQDCDDFRIGFKTCCDIIDAHDPSMARNAAPPSPTEITSDIQKLKNWVASLRDRQKHIK